MRSWNNEEFWEEEGGSALYPLISLIGTLVTILGFSQGS
jgi:hypothetical protein